MKRVLFPLSAALLTACFAGCATENAAEKTAENAAEKAPQAAPAPGIPADREPEAKAAAEKLALGMAEALKTGDFAKFDAVQPKSGRPIPSSVFSKLRRSISHKYGKFERAEYFGKLEQGPANDYLWKFVFAAPAESGKAPIRREIVYWVRVGFVQGKPVVYGCRFDLH